MQVHKELYKELSKENALIRLIVLTFLGAGIQIILIVFSIWQFTFQIRTSPQPFADVTPDPIILLTYFVLTIAYSVGASLSFHPKRIVSPLYIQLTAATLLTIIIAYAFMQFEPPIQDPTFIQNLIAMMAMLYMLLGLTGFAQTEIVRRIVGLNGTEEDLDRKTFSINASFDIVAPIISRDSFLNLADFRITKRTREFLILQSKLRTFEKLVFALIPDPTDQHKCILATVAYELRYYHIAKTEDASEMRNMVVSHLKEKLRNLNPSYSVSNHNLDDVASVRVRNIALSDTQSKLVGLKDIPRYHLFAMVATAIVFIVMTAAFIVNVIDRDLYVSSLVIIIIAVLFEFAPLLKEARSSRSVEY